MARTYSGPPSWRFTPEDLHKPLMRENYTRAVLAETLDALTAGNQKKAMELLVTAVTRLSEADR